MSNIRKILYTKVKKKKFIDLIYIYLNYDVNNKIYERYCKYI